MDQARRNHQVESVARIVLLACASFVILAMVLLLGYLISEGTKTFTTDHVSVATFLFSPNFAIDDGKPGSLVFIVGTLAVTLFAIVIGGPFGIAVGVFLAEIAPARMTQILKPAIEVMVGIPSVVYGWLGLTLLVPLIRTHTTSPSGFGLAAAGIVLAIMILPTVASVTIEVLRTMPSSLREGALALGATRWEAIRAVVLPYANRGILGAIILGLARALGETMAVTMLIGNQPEIHFSLFAAGYSLPSVIANEFAEASGAIHTGALAGLALILFGVTLLLSAGARLLVRLSAKRLVAA